MKKDIKVIEGDNYRVDTGPLRFGDDWPGVFIRGDHCARHLACLNMIIKKHPDLELSLSELRDLLKSSQV